MMRTGRTHCFCSWVLNISRRDAWPAPLSPLPFLRHSRCKASHLSLGLLHGSSDSRRRRAVGGGSVCIVLPRQGCETTSPKAPSSSRQEMHSERRSLLSCDAPCSPHGCPRRQSHPRSLPRGHGI